MRILSALLAAAAFAARSLAASSSDGSLSRDPSVGDSTTSLLALASTSARPGWLEQSRVVGALTSAAASSLANGDALVDGVVVHIAPRFVVTSTNLMSERGLARLRDASIDARAVVFSTGAARVTRVVFQPEVSNDPRDPLIVLELENEPGSASLVPVVTSKPNKDFEYEQLTLVHVHDVLDTKALLIPRVGGRVVNVAPKTESKLTFFVEPMCGYKMSVAGDDSAQLCVGPLTRATGTSLFDAGSWHEHRELAEPRLPWNITHPGTAWGPPMDKNDKNNTNRLADVHAPPLHNVGADISVNGPIHSVGANASVNAHVPGHNIGATPLQGAQFGVPAVLFYDNALVGLSIPVLTPPKRFETPLDSKHGFLRVASSHHRAFLDAATNASARYTTDDVFSKLAKYPSYLATFLDSNGRSLSCQGVLIAPKFVLTTASCLHAQTDLSAVQFFASDAAARETVSIVPGHMAPHPRYTAGDVTFDTAVVALARAVTFAPIQLADGSVDDTASLARIQLADDQCVISATVAADSFDKCRPNAPNGRSFRSSEAFCVLPVAPTDANATSFSVRDFLGDDAIATLTTPQSTTTGAALVTVTHSSSVALVGLAIAPPQTRARGLQATGSGEVYVRVANSATFINAYVAGTSWSVPSRMTIVDTMDIELQPSEQFVVGLRTTKDGQNYCGGSLIGPTSVLTAAHCVVDGPAHYVSVGAYNSSGVDAEVIAVVSSKTQIHSHYGSPHQFSYDIAILELAYASAVKPVALDNTTDFVDRETATMYGYGMTSATSGLSPTLRAVPMPLWSRAACSQVFGSDVDDSMLCAGGEKGKDACTGDSGSPLVVNRAGENVLVGVVSAGAGCGLANVPGVYARVQSIGDFVRTHVIGAVWASGNSGSSSSANNTTSSPEDRSMAPGTQDPSAFQARETSNTPAASSQSTTDPATTTSPATGPYNVFTLALGDLPSLVRTSLMDFLLGDDSDDLVDSTLTRAMRASDNVLQFYSTGDVNALLNIVKRHNQQPLNQRSNRFGQWSSAYANATSYVCVV